MFEKVIKKYFEDIYQYEENTVLRTILFRVPWEDISYDSLEAVSQILGTKLINFHSLTESGGYCNTCGWESSATIVECLGVRFSNEDPIHEKSEIVKLEDVYVRE